MANGLGAVGKGEYFWLGSNATSQPVQWSGSYETTATDSWTSDMQQYPHNGMQSGELEAMRRAMGGQQAGGASQAGVVFQHIPNDAESGGLRTLKLIKKSVKQIKADAVSPEAQKRVRDRIERLEKLGVKAQATILQTELMVRVKLARIKEWDYKVLPYDAVKEFDGKVVHTYTLRVHIDPLDKYIGVVPDATMEAKNKIIPDFVLDRLELAADRKVFDAFAVLWVEKVKDPLLLGCIEGCKDYFLIAEWGEDISFDEIVKKK